MQEVEKFLPFVKSQHDFHERKSGKFPSGDRRNRLHEGTANNFDELYQFLVSLREKRVSSARATKGLHLSWNELEDLPEELLEELSLTEADKLEYSIAELIENCGGVVSLDRLLVEIFKLTGKVLKRQNLNARLYRMAQKEMIFNVPSKKGVYSSQPLTEEDAEKLK